MIFLIQFLYIWRINERNNKKNDNKVLIILKNAYLKIDYDFNKIYIDNLIKSKKDYKIWLVNVFCKFKRMKIKKKKKIIDLFEGKMKTLSKNIILI